MVSVLASLIFALGYLFITLEHRIHVSKSAFALFMGGILWIIVALAMPGYAGEEFLHVGYDIFNIVIFLLAAMSLVEVLVHYRLFDIVRDRISAIGLTDTYQYLVIVGVAFFLSGIIDNLTTTIVMIQIARKFFRGENLLVAAVGIVISANAGGAFSPIGDVTTIMLWLAGKFGALDVIAWGFLPSVALLGVASFMLVRKIKDNTPLESEKISPVVLSGSEKFVVGVTLFSFLLPIGAKAIHLPPVLGLLLGVGIVWIIIDLLRAKSSRESHLTASIEALIQKTDIASIKFFIGILLAVAALNALGILGTVSELVYGSAPSLATVVVGNIFIGSISAVLDNIPLTAIAIDILTVTDPVLWVLLALAVGTGGSMLAIGSAAGVIAMGMVKELSFAKYFKIGFLPALVSFLVCMGVWYAQYAIFVGV